ncbi:MAG: epoxyqueuosine reductase QueH [Oscillospiraceae bacterium]|nr:epoxyqueuosine reductase QueH [Oscillospiraceae bacterium]
MKYKILTHVCCAPCLICTEPFVSEFELSCFWYNPNIHPFSEYKSRLDCLSDYAFENNIRLITEDFYGLMDFIGLNPDERCAYCYDIRLEETAKRAKINGFNMFSTTLLCSPYQNREKIKETGEKYSRKYGVEFFPGDFRGNFREGQKRAKEKSLYMQKYCGCIFSEYDRYKAEYKNQK